jgi:hypothetical protein
MTSLSCADSFASIAAIAFSIVRARLPSNVTVPARASSTRVLTSSWARSGSVCFVAETT